MAVHVLTTVLASLESMFRHSDDRRGGSDRLEQECGLMDGWMDGWIVWMKEWYVCSVIK